MTEKIETEHSEKEELTPLGFQRILLDTIGLLKILQEKNERDLPKEDAVARTVRTFLLRRPRSEVKEDLIVQEIEGASIKEFLPPGPTHDLKEEKMQGEFSFLRFVLGSKIREEDSFFKAIEKHEGRQRASSSSELEENKWYLDLRDESDKRLYLPVDQIKQLKISAIPIREPRFYP